MPQIIDALNQFSQSKNIKKVISLVHLGEGHDYHILKTSRIFLAPNFTNDVLINAALARGDTFEALNSQ